jgi:hypothetical protein
MQADKVSSKRGLLGLVVVAPLLAFGAALNGAPRNDQKALTIDVSDPRPLARAIYTLEQRYGWVITYEDPPYVYVGDIADVTPLVANDYGSRPSRPRVLIPAGGSFAFTYTVLDGANPAPDERALLEGLLAAYHSGARPSAFDLTRTGAVFHVTPSMSRNVAGNVETRASILNTAISLAAEDRTALAMVVAIANEVGRSVGVDVVPGTMPLSLLARVRIHAGVSNESARTVLLRTLDATHCKLSWRLLYSPGPTGGYALNVHEVRGSREWSK